MGPGGAAGDAWVVDRSAPSSCGAATSDSARPAGTSSGTVSTWTSWAGLAAGAVVDDGGDGASNGGSAASGVGAETTTAPGAACSAGRLTRVTSEAGSVGPREGAGGPSCGLPVAADTGK